VFDSLQDSIFGEAAAVCHWLLIALWW